MTANEKPVPVDLPTNVQLLRSTLTVVAVAVTLVVTTVLPAEIGFDPTGVGRWLGLTQMGEMKVALQQPTPPAATSERIDDVQPQITTAAQAKSDPQSATTAPGVSEAHVSVVRLEPDEAVEIKVQMLKGRTIAFEWFTDGPRVNFDLHGDAKDIDYFRYARGSESRAQGELTAEFDGAHGWYWRNRSAVAATITLRVRGDFISVRKLD
jgi:hypothetical protein